MTISIQKSFILHISFKDPNIKYYTCGSDKASKDIICDLGVHVSDNFSFNYHIYIICKEAYWVINKIFRSFCCKDNNVYVKAYSSYVRSHLEHASCIWSPYKCFKMLKGFVDCNLNGCLVHNEGQNRGHQFNYYTLTVD